MTAKQAKHKGYTHQGCMYGVDIYLTDDEDMNVVGQTYIKEKLLMLFIWIDITFNINDGVFPILKGKKL